MARSKGTRSVSRGRSRSPRSYVSSVGSVAAAAAAGAVALYNNAKRSRSREPSRPPRSASKPPVRIPFVSTPRRSKSRFSGSGKYAGKFKKGRKSVNQYLSSGFKITTEITGSVSDPDCVYLGHSTFSGYQALSLAQACLVRKLLLKAGYSINAMTEKLGEPFRFELLTKNDTDGVITAYTYENLITETIFDIVGDLATGTTGSFGNLFNVTLGYVVGNTSNDLSVTAPWQLNLYIFDTGVVNTFRKVCTLPLREMFIHLKAKSELKIQNRSVSATGSESVDTVNSNPIEGRSYSFKTAAPRSKIDGMHLVEAVPDFTGVITTRATAMPTTGSTTATDRILKEPPPASVFWNQSVTKKVRLEPGHIKSDHIQHTMKMSYIKWLDTFVIRNAAIDAVGSHKQQKLPGTCTLFAFEDTINLNSTYYITCAYECNREVECMFTQMKPRASLGQYYAITQNSTAP